MRGYAICALFTGALLMGCGKQAGRDAPSVPRPPLVKGLAPASGSVPSAFEQAPPAGAKARCPVSKEIFTVKPVTASASYKGKTYFFCCPECKPDFEKDPEKYARP